MIADDEAPARRKLARFLAEHADVTVVAEASNGLDAVDLAAITAPQILFLDIHMPDLDGIGVAEALASSAQPPAIVFATAYDEYAIKAFEVNALDYLLKPYDRERFDRALERARATALAAPSGERLAHVLATLRREERYAKRMLIPNDGRSFYVGAEEIARLEADGNNVIVHSSRGAHRLRATLASLESRLDPVRFARVHRSHVVNIESIAEIRPWFHGDYVIVMRDGTELAWSRRYVALRRDLLE